MEKQEIKKFPKRRMRLAHEFKLEKMDMENPVGKSMTVPNQAFTIQDLLDKFTQGVDVGNYREGVYDSEDMDFEDEDLEKVPRLDVVERENLLSSVKEKNQSIQEKIKKQSEKKSDRKSPPEDEAPAPKPKPTPPKPKRSEGEEGEGEG